MFDNSNNVFSDKNANSVEFMYSFRLLLQHGFSNHFETSGRYGVFEKPKFIFCLESCFIKVDSQVLDRCMKTPPSAGL